MVFEIATIAVKAGSETDFEAGVSQALPLFQRAKGCSGAELQRSIEHPNVYRLVVKWATVENHMVDFRNSDDFQEWRRLVGPHFERAPEVEHTSVVVAGF